MSENQELELECIGENSVQSEEFMYEPIDMDIQSVYNLGYDEVEFQRGVDSVSFVAGRISALKNTGLPWNLVMDYIFNAENIEFNLEATKNANETAIRVAEKQQSVIDKNTI